MHAPRSAAALLVLAAAGAVLLGTRVAEAGGGPAETVVLVNAASPESKRVAEHYAKARGIPRSRICEVKCTSGLEVPIADFVRDVADPLRDFLRRGGMEDRVRYVVLTQGMPIRARTPRGDVSTAAALSLLHTPVCGQDQSQIGSLGNPYRSGPARTAKAGEAPFLLVTALLSTTADEAIGLVDRSVASDGTAPPQPHFVFQDAKGAAGVRNGLYDAARAQLEALGATSEHVPVGKDAAAGRKRVLGYMAGGAYSDLTPDGVKTIEFLPGAISDHLQSFGSVPQNFSPDAGKHTQFPVTHLVRAGVTGVHGAVAEPYNNSFPGADLFEPYLRGHTLGEAFHLKSPFVYWMNLTLGDPLCAPYAVRPKVAGTAGFTKETGVLRVEADAPGAVRMEAFVAGRRVASAEGASLRADVPAAELTDDGAGVLVQAVGPGEHEPTGWTTLPVSLAGLPARPAADRPKATAVTAEAPATARAGEPFEATLTLSAPEAWKGRVEVRTAVPPVLVLARDVEATGGAVKVPLRWERAGDVELRVRLPDDGVESVVRCRVEPAAPAFATTPLSRVPLNQPTDIDVETQDAFGNVAPSDWELGIVAPGANGAVLPGRTSLVGGRGVFRDVLLPRAGAQPLVFTDRDGVQRSSPAERVEVQRTAIRAWIVSQARTGEGASKLFDADLTAADRDGAVASGLLFRRRRERDDRIDLLGTAKDGDTAAAVTVLDVLAPGKVRFLAAAPGRTKVVLGDRVLFDGVPKETDAGGKREEIAVADLAAGPVRLVVVAERKGNAAFSLEIDDGAGGTPAVFVLPMHPDTPPASRVVSGRVRRGPTGGVSGAVIRVTGSDGKERKAASAADGTWFVADLPAGAVTARVEGLPDPVTPAERTLDLADGHGTDLDFVVTDRTPPTLRVERLPGRVGKRFVAEPQASDDDAVREVRLRIDGKEIARTTTAPFRIDADVSAVPRGRHRVELVATDASGNASAPVGVEVQFIEPSGPPKVSLKGIGTAPLKKKVTVTATVSGELPLAEFRFRLDGKDLGPPLTKLPYEIEIDGAALAEGAHTLEGVARDMDGTEGRDDLKFKSAKK